MKNQSTLLLLILLSIPFYAGAQIVDIPDSNFKNALINTTCADLNGDGAPEGDVDTNDDVEIQVSEALAVWGLHVPNAHIASMTGIEQFTHLKQLYCDGNSLTSLPVEQLTELNLLNCYGNSIETLNVGNLTNLQNLNCDDNNIASLNLQNLHRLVWLDCSQNNLTSLDVHGLDSLVILSCNFNQLTTLNLQGTTALVLLSCAFNQISALDLQESGELVDLDCSDNLLTTLDLQDTRFYGDIRCGNNQLTTLFMKGVEGIISEIYFGNNPLVYICCEESRIVSIQEQANEYGLTNCSINSFCSFAAGGSVTHQLNGINRIDTDLNGCDSDDPVYPNLPFEVSDGVTTGSFIAPASGDFTVVLQPGAFTVIPVVANTGYFVASPDTLELNFSTTPQTVTQDFCLVPNGQHHDVEANLLPLSPARPGFESTYRIDLRNKSSQSESGTIFFIYNSEKISFESASVAPDAQSSDTLRWNFVHLDALESMSIEVELTVNTPAQNPPVNAGDVLNFSAYVQIQEIDEVPADNFFPVHQTVVGSYDPNDKTCLEGTQITPEMVGDYLHYLIRFENTGTFAAENVVVKDVIDESTFDLASLRLVEASHDCFVRINANQVEFIFENIQLPFTEPDKHGFVLFKIKTKPGLDLGTAITNKASIYFDYNLPVITNVASTNVSEASAVYSPGEQRMNLRLQPNPAQDVLFLQADQVIERVEIYDALGRIVLAASVANRQIDVKNLPSGTYLLKAFGNNVFATKQFVRR